MPTDTFYEVHAEHDGHVTGSYDKEKAVEMAAQLSEEYQQEHEVIEVEETY